MKIQYGECSCCYQKERREALNLEQREIKIQELKKEIERLKNSPYIPTKESEDTYF